MAPLPRISACDSDSNSVIKHVIKHAPVVRALSPTASWIDLGGPFKTEKIVVFLLFQIWKTLLPFLFRKGLTL